MDFETVSERLLTSNNAEDFIEEETQVLVDHLKRNELNLLELVKGLDPVLTNASYETRSKGVDLLSKTIVALPKDHLSEREIQVISDFLTLRLIDHKTMEQAALRCLLYFLSCKNKPAPYNRNLLDFVKTKVSIRRMDAKNRRLIYEILKKVVSEKQKISRTVDGELIYSFVSIMEGENNPENLIVCFGIMSNILKTFNDIEPYIDDIFEWLSSYYPLDYTPSDSSDTEALSKIQRSDLVQSLYDCFFANPLNADCLLSLLLEKLDSNLMSSKLESLECVIRCYDTFPLDSIKKYNSTLWTAIRSNCLRRIDMIDAKFYDLCLRTLSSLARRLSEDRELHFAFLSDMYEELAIAFRKPEMDLFEPAAKLLTQAISPNILGFNYVLDKVLPLALNSLESNELRPLPGLVYIFDQANIHHPNLTFEPDITQHVQKLTISVLNHLKSSAYSLKLLVAIFSNRIKFEGEVLNQVSTRLCDSYREDRSPDLEECLAKLSLNYKILHLVAIAPRDYTLPALVEAINEIERLTDPMSIHIYIKSLILSLHDSTESAISELSRDRLKDFLAKARLIAGQRADRNLVDKIALLHAIIINKLRNEDVEPIMMDLFSSDFCQKLIPSTSNDDSLSLRVYLPVISWTLKSLVIRNHPLFLPLVNLLLNFITSDRICLNAAIDSSRAFGFILSDKKHGVSEDSMWSLERHYKKFVLHKQKFYAHSSREIKIRYGKEQQQGNNEKLLLCSLALQIPHLPLAVYKRDIEWLLRELIRVLTTDVIINGNDHEDLLCAMFDCLENLIQRDFCEKLVGFLPSLIELNLKHAQCAKTMRVRQSALKCLSRIPGSFKHSDLLVYRSATVDRLRSCLADKKRLVRQSAAEARLRWSLIGQPIGS